VGVRPGYKRTEIGVIPKDWGQDKICNHASITTGAKDTKDKIDDGKYPFFVRSPIVERINSYSFDGEAVLTAGDGVGTGRVFHYINGKFDFHQRVYRISDFSKDLDGYFFYLYFSTHFYNRIMSMTAKSSVDSVRMEMIADMMIPLPPLPEQRAIAEVLSDVDALIGALDRLIAKKRAIKQGTMQQLLTGKTRLPGFGKVSAEYKQTEVGVIPEDWGQDSIGNLASITTGAKDTQDRVEGGEYPFFVRSPIVERISSYSFDGEAVLTAGDGVGTGKIFHYTDGKFDFHQRVYKISNFRTDLDGYFFYLYFSTHFYNRVMSMTAKSSVDSVRMEMVADMAIPLPPIAEQGAIAAILSDMDAEIAALETRREKTRALKQGMMQELLTGRIRLV
jgi:type I restriction enzyme S subunit